MRLKLLIAAHIVAAPWLGGPGSFPFPQLMLLCFWAGMGTSTGGRRLLGTLLGVAYLAFWQTQGSSNMSWVVKYSMMCNIHLIGTAFMGGTLLGMRRWKAELRRVSDSEETTSAARFQFSLLFVLMIITAVAVILGSVLSMQPATSDRNTSASGVAAILLFVTVPLLNLLCAVWATLSIGRVGWRILLAFAVSTALALAFSFPHSIIWRAWSPKLMFAWTLFFVAMPTAIVVGSLLVVRWCGYRLVPKSLALGSQSAPDANGANSAHQPGRGRGE